MRKKRFPDEQQVKWIAEGLRSAVSIITHELNFLDRGGDVARICINTCMNVMRHLVDVYDVLAAQNDPKFKERRQKELAKLWELKLPTPRKPKP